MAGADAAGGATGYAGSSLTLLYESHEKVNQNDDSEVGFDMQWPFGREGMMDAKKRTEISFEEAMERTLARGGGAWLWRDGQPVEKLQTRKEYVREDAGRRLFGGA